MSPGSRQAGSRQDEAGEEPRGAVFLDRDGTIIDELGYLGDPDGVKLYPGAAAALRRLNEAGLALVLVTNQSGIARGFFTEDDLARVHERLEALLADEGAHIDLWLHCPHHPTAGVAPWRNDCDCRKPQPGLLLQAAELLPIDLASSWMVGDSARDLEAARRAGLTRRLLVATGKGADEDRELRAGGDDEHELMADLAAAVERILATG